MIAATVTLKKHKKYDEVYNKKQGPDSGPNRPAEAILRVDNSWFGLILDYWTLVI